MNETVESALRAFDPAVNPPRLAGGDVGYVVEEYGIGRLLLAARPDGTLLTSTYVPTDADADAVLDRLARQVSPGILRGGTATDDARRQLEQYLAGERREFDLPTDPVLATPFQRTVLDRLVRDVGYGRTTSYGALAGAIGRPTASRAVGAALGANPLCIVLPCHRVVAASGALTGYAGGVAAKQTLLELEAAA
jgi:methylated-DNA-[protein]-cysteine S-methyltransferase